MTEQDAFLAAIELPDRAARGAYLEKACGADAALRGRVEALLRAHDAAGSFLEVPLVAPPQPGGAKSIADPLATIGGDAATVPTVPPLMGDRYILGEEIARGGMGVVHRATDTVLGREVAVKVLGDRYESASAGAQRFADEARIAAQLQHPGIPPVHDLGAQPDGRPFLAMKLIHGRTLDHLLANRPNPAHDRGRFVAVFEQVCQTVAYAHSHHVIHRDLKPANVMVGEFGEVQVMDWGLAKVLTETGPAGGDPSATVAEANVRSLRDSDGTFTQAGSVLGTPAFMPPEQALGMVGKIDRRSDVFGLGAVLAVILTGEPPFAAGSFETRRLRAAQGLVGDCLARLDECGADPALVALCKRCLAPEQQDRPADAGAVARAVASLRAAADERARQAELGLVRAEGERLAAEARAVEQRKRRRVQLALAAALVGLIAVAGFGVAIASFWQRAEQAKEIAVSERGKAEEAQRIAEQAKAAESGERKKAEEARDSAVVARGLAERARAAEEAAKKEAEREREKLAVFEYGRAVEVAHQEWRENNVSTTLMLLAGTRQDLRGWEWHYVHRLCQSELLSLRGHTGAVSSAIFSTDGSRIVTAGMDRTARVWDARSGAERLILKGHTDGVRSASFSPDGSRVATSGSDWTARVWDAESGAELLTLKGHTDGVMSVSFSPDGVRVVTASRDRTARVWDAKSGAELLALTGHANAVSSASFNPDGSRIVTTSGDHTARVWDAESGVELLVLKGHGGVNSASFSPDGSRVVTGGYDRTARVWDATSGVELLLVKGHTSGVASASFSPDGSRIVTASVDTTARIWDAQGGGEMLAIRGHTDGVRFAAFSPNGTRVVTAGVDSTRVWDTRFEPVSFAIKAHADGVRSARFNSDGTGVITTGGDGTVRIWDARTGAEVINPKGNTDTAPLASLSTDESWVVTTSGDRTARVRDAKSGVELLVLKGHADTVSSASFSPDRSRIVTGSEDTTARVWDARTGAELLVLKGHGDAVSSAAFSPDGSRIVTGSWDKTVRVWDSRAFRDTRPPDVEFAPPPRTK